MFNHNGVYQLNEAANTSLPQRGQRSTQHISKADGRRDCGNYGGYYKVSEALQRDRNYCTADPSVIQSIALKTLLRVNVDGHTIYDICSTLVTAFAVL